MDVLEIFADLRFPETSMTKSTGPIFEELPVIARDRMCNRLASPRPGAWGLMSATPTIRTNGSLAKISIKAVPPRPAPMITTSWRPGARRLLGRRACRVHEIGESLAWVRYCAASGTLFRADALRSTDWTTRDGEEEGRGSISPGAAGPKL